MRELAARPNGEPDRGLTCPKSRLVGRDAELAALLGLGEAVRAGLGRAVLIIGEPGLGKTRLLDEWQSADRATAARPPLRWTRGSCPSDSRGLAHHLLLSLLRSLIGVPPTASEPDVRAALSALIQDLFASGEDGGSEPGQGRGAAMYAFLAHLLSLEPEGPAAGGTQQLDPQTLQAQYLVALRQLLQALAVRGPLVLILENLHWADPSSTELLIRLLPLAAAVPVLFCLVTRPDYDAPGWKMVAAVRELMGGSLTELTLPALSGPDSRQLVSELLCPGTVPEEILTLVLTKAEGNPLFIEQVVRALVDRGAIVLQEGQWVLRKEIASVEIPDTLQGALLARIDRLPDEARTILHVASVIGRQFPTRVLEQVLNRPRTWLVGHLNALESAGLVSVSQVTPELAYRFQSALVQEVAYHSMLASDRQRMHLAVGETMERIYPREQLSGELASILAHHFLQSFASGSDYAPAGQRALEYLTLAGDAALAAYANREAEGHYRQALELARGLAHPQVGLADLLFGLGEALSRQSCLREAIQVWREGIGSYRAMGDGDRVARLYALAARAAWYCGEPAEGWRLCQEGLAAVDGLPDSPGVAVLVHEAARALYFNGQAPDQARPLCLRALEMARRLNAVEVEAEALATLGILPDQPPEAAMSVLTRAVELAESAGLLPQARRAHNNLASILQESLADFRAAQEHLQRAAELSRQTGSVEGEIVALSNLEGLLLLTGDLERAETVTPTLRRLLDESANPGPAAMGMRINEALRWRYRGELAEAIRQLRACQVEARQRGEAEHLFLASSSLAEAVLESWTLPGFSGVGETSDENAAQIEAVLVEAIEIGDQRPPAGSMWPRCLLGMVRARQGRFQDARCLVAETREMAGARLAPLGEVRLLWAEATIAAVEHRWAEAFAAFESVTALFERLGMRWWWARALYGWAEAYISRGEPADLDRARALLREAQAMFEELHVPRYATWARERSQASMAHLYAYALAHRQVTQELVIAGQVQMSFLPASPPSVPGWQLSAVLKPARETSGDFFDFIPLPNGRWGIVVADVADKGIGAALYMALSRTLIRTYASEYHARPDFALRVTNRRILTDTQADTFVTAFYGVFDPSTGILNYCNAGHNPPYLLHVDRSADAGEAARIVAQPLHRTGMALGVTRDAMWEEAVIHMDPGSLLLLYTDGITEAHNAQATLFGEERMLQAVQTAIATQAGQGLTAQDIQNALLTAVREFAGDTPQFDDITLMIIVRDLADGAQE